jgi:hypothetical protein
MSVGLVCCNDTPSCTGGSVATGKGFHARQIGGERPGKEATHWSFRSAGGLGGRLTNMFHKT